MIGDQADAIRELPVVAVQSKILDRVDQLPGEIEAYQDVAIYPKVPGFIKGSVLTEALSSRKSIDGRVDCA